MRFLEAEKSPSYRPRKADDVIQSKPKGLRTENHRGANGTTGQEKMR